MSHKNYKHLSFKERVSIELYRNDSLGVNQIAKKLNRSPSTISREIKRNPWEFMNTQYNSTGAQRYYKTRIKTATKRVSFMILTEVQIYVESRIKLGWSPEIIAGRMKFENYEYPVSHETIYQYIYKKKPELIKYLRWNRKKRQKRGKTAKNHLPNRVFIDERDESINNREEIGHWEGDTMESSRKGKSHLNVLVERKMKLTKISRIENKTPDETKKKVIKVFNGFPEKLRKTITLDNGIENRDHEKIAKTLNMRIFFCHPYCGWEKGTVENTIGLIRYYLPKKTNLDNISDERIAEIEALLNNRPRKILGFKTPLEALESVALIT